MITCEESILMMNLYLDEMLEQDETAQLFAHLEQCEECRKRFKSFQLITSETRALPDEAPPDLHRLIMAGIEKQRRSGVVIWRRWSATAAACAAMVLLVIAGVRGDRLPQSGTMRSMAPDMANESAEPPQAVAPQAAPMQIEPAKDFLPQGEGLDAQMKVEKGSLFSSEDSDDPFDWAVLPQLRNTNSYGEYLVAYGTAPLPGLFEEASISRFDEDSQIFIEISRSDVDQAAQALEAVGYTIAENVLNLPPVAEENEKCLIIVLEQ